MTCYLFQQTVSITSQMPSNIQLNQNLHKCTVLTKLTELYWVCRVCSGK